MIETDRKSFRKYLRRGLLPAFGNAEDRLCHAGGSPKVLGRMKELWSYLMYSFDEPQDIWRKIKKINALKEYEEAVETVFQEHHLIQ